MVLLWEVKGQHLSSCPLILQVVHLRVCSWGAKERVTSPRLMDLSVSTISGAMVHLAATLSVADPLWSLWSKIPENRMGWVMQ